MKYFQLILLFAIPFQSFSQCWIKIAASSSSSFAIRADGTLWAWGKNEYGQLGDGTSIDKNLPTQIGTDSNWADIDTNSYNTLALKTDGTLWEWGRYYSEESIAFHTTPVQIGSDNDWLKIAAWGCALKSNGTLWLWGYNEHGELGLGDEEPHYIPTQLGSDNDWVDISSGGWGRLAIKSDNSMWGWGMNYSGALAIGVVNSGSVNLIIPTPTQTGNQSNDWSKAIYNGCCFTKMIKNDGTLWGQGSGTFGNLGDGNVAEHLSNIPIPIGTDNDWNAVDTSYHTLAIKNNGTLWGWGNNFSGQLGDGTTTNKSIPTATGIGNTWMSISVGLSHTIGLSSDGTLFTWGYNGNGQLGDGTLIGKHIPTQIAETCLLSAAKFPALKSIMVYPNPTRDKAVLRYILQENSNAKISLYNITGQLLYSQESQSIRGENETIIDLSSLENAVYFVSIEGENFFNITKFVKG